MRPTREQPTANDYYRWRTGSFAARGKAFDYAAKPGVHSFGRSDPATQLLAKHIQLGGACQVLDLNCGTGVVGVCAAIHVPEATVNLVDRNHVAVEAARRTVALNNLRNVNVYFGNGTCNVPRLPMADIVTIRLPKGKLPILQLIWDAFHILREGGSCYVAGANDEGIKSSLTRLEELFGNTTVLGYDSGCRVAIATKTTGLPIDTSAFDPGSLNHEIFHKFTLESRGIQITVSSRPGVFAWDRLDEGSRLLMDQMEIAPDARVLDLGCGNGVVGTVAALLASKGWVHFVDSDFEAIKSATETIRSNGCMNSTVLAGDAFTPVPGETFDVIVTNPPFHVTHRAELSMAEEFIKGAALALRSAGRLFLVANITLPYERIINQHFKQFQCISSDLRYKVLKAWEPRV